MPGLLDELVERRIREAAQRGEFDDLPGAGRPLQLDDDPLVPEELRAAYRLLKNAGYVPPEVDHLRELGALLSHALAAEDTLPHAAAGASRPADDPSSQAEAARRQRRMLALTLALEQRGVDLGGAAALAYRQAIVDRIGGRDHAGPAPAED